MILNIMKKNIKSYNNDDLENNFDDLMNEENFDLISINENENQNKNIH